MIKKLIMVVLMVCLTGLIPNSVLATDFTLVLTHDSRYIFDGVDFAGKDDAALNMIGLSVKKKSFGSFFYAAVTEDYFEWGVDLNYTFSLGGLELKSTLFPFGWSVPGETYLGFMAAEEATINNSVVSIKGRYAYAYIPDLRELNGHYFYLGMNKDVMGFNLQAGLNYNKGLFIGENEGLGAILSISKSLQLNEKVFLDVYFKYYINHPSVNEDEPVVGTSLAIGL